MRTSCWSIRLESQALVDPDQAEFTAENSIAYRALLCKDNVISKFFFFFCEKVPENAYVAVCDKLSPPWRCGSVWLKIMLYDKNVLLVVSASFAKLISNKKEIIP